MQTLLDTRQLRAFLVLAREGTFTAAGKALHLTQSAVSYAIKSLEADLGCELFHRQGREVSLTPHGRELLTHAETIEVAMGHARASLGALDQDPRGEMKIGCTPAAAQYILPTVLREFQDSFPHYNISIVPGESPDILERLEKNKIDVGLCLKPRDVSGLQWQSLLSDELMFVVDALHPWRKQAPRTKDLAEQAFIVSSRQSATYDLIQDYFLKLGVRPRSLIELGNTEAIKELVKLGLGVAVMAPWVAGNELAAGSLATVPLLRGRIVRHWIVAQLKDRPQTLAQRTFTGLCQEVGAELAEKFQSVG
ncbi:MAG: LysR family transcriptional regulator [Verrucomicrobiales bacterium]|nr:LysR family transcriptional regulator [Verrucomicrobiales bacterium]MCP5557042.1 LysR family transcriptional regulator [Verrucomicrobiaceae bacterium]